LRVWPNPLRETASISFRLDAPGPVVLTLHDALGREIRRLETSAAGTRGGTSGVDGSIRWDGRDGRGRAVPGGVYVMRLSAGETTRAARVLVLR
jgi:hypothetical protein